MSKKRYLIASDIHWCHIDWYGVPTEERMARFVRHVKEEYEKEPFEALLLLGDYSLDHWKWNIKGSWLAEGKSYTKVFTDRVVAPLKELGIPLAMIAGNHEQYGEVLWHAITGYARRDYVVCDDVLFILPDTFGTELDPTEHSDGKYLPADVAYIREIMAKYPDHRVILCAHHFAPAAESEEFRALVRDEERILCLFGGHVHKSDVVELGDEWGGKALLYTGNYSYNTGKEEHAQVSMWGFRDLYLSEDTLLSRYITPENVITLCGQEIVHPYGVQDVYERTLK